MGDEEEEEGEVERLREAAQREAPVPEQSHAWRRLPCVKAVICRAVSGSGACRLRVREAPRRESRAWWRGAEVVMTVRPEARAHWVA